MSEPEETAPEALEDWLRTQVRVTQLLVHDLKNPLAAIVANADYLTGELRSNANALEAVEDIQTSTRWLHQLIDNLSVLAQLEAALLAGGSTPPAPVPLGDMLRGAVQRQTPRARARRQTLKADLPPGEVYVLGHRDLVDQIGDNLLANAVQHSPTGSEIHLTLTCEGDKATLVLRDQGPAFGSIDRDFSRVGQLAIKNLPDGRYSRGLGLYLVALGVRVCKGAIVIPPGADAARLSLVLPTVPA